VAVVLISDLGLGFDVQLKHQKINKNTKPTFKSKILRILIITKSIKTRNGKHCQVAAKPTFQILHFDPFIPTPLHPSPISRQFGVGHRTHSVLTHTKFHLDWCTVSPLRGHKTLNLTDFGILGRLLTHTFSPIGEFGM